MIKKKLSCQCRKHKRPRFDPWIGKISWRKKMATHSSILPWRIPWTEEFGRLQSMGLKESDKTEQLTLFTIRINKGEVKNRDCWGKKKSKIEAI